MSNSDDRNGIVIQAPAATVQLSAPAPRVFTSAGLPWLVNAYSGALGRFRVASERDDRSPQAVFVPLFEALAWFDAADEYLKHAKTPIGEPRVRAVRYARRRVHHQWADAVHAVEYEVEAGAGPLRVCGVTFDWFWKPEQHLPPAPPEYSDPKGARLYQELLGTRPAREALDSVEKYLVNQVNRGARR